MAGAVIGSYRLLDQLGEGGTGTVWAAEHTLLGRRAAIKLLHPAYSANKLMVQRLFNEAKVVAAIADPGMVQIFDFGVHGDGSPYIVMELLDGEPLDARLRRLGRLAPEDAVRLARQVALSLSAAHGKGVIHRDLKPENLFVVPDPAVIGGERVKVLDFGIAKLSRSDGSHKTRTGAVIGTPAYMSPEQCRAIGNIDHRADIYSLGAVLFCLVTGRPPFEGEGAGDAIISHVRDLPPVPSALVPGLPAALDAVILRCLEKDPARRFQGMDELADALGGLDSTPRERAATAGLERRAATLGGGPPAAPVSPSLEITTVSAATGEVSSGWRTVLRWRWVGLALSAAAGLVIAIAIASGGPGEQAPEPAKAVPEEPMAAPEEPAAAPAKVVPAEPVVTPEEPAAVEAKPVPVEAKPAAVEAKPAAVEAKPVPRSTPAPKPRNNRRANEGTTRHGADKKAKPGSVERIDRGD